MSKQKRAKSGVSTANFKLPQSATESTIAFFEECLVTMLEERQGFFVSAIRERLKSEPSPQTVRAEPEVGAIVDWLVIDSLSKLRAVVGGRFKNIKEKWIAAGFPLRDSKGSDIKEHKVDQAGWIELSAWISNQGFESRLTPDNSNCLFMVRKLS